MLGEVKNIVVAGAAGQLGRVVVQQALRKGLSVVSLCRQKTEERQLLEFLSGTEREDHVVLVGDLSQAKTCEENINRAQSILGSIDALLILSGGFRYGKVEDTTEDDFDFLFSANMKSTWLLTRYTLRHMRENGLGRMVMISSQNTLGQGVEGQSLYLASKAALNMFLHCLAAETKQHNIKVNALLPSVIDTPSNRASMPGANFKEWITPESIADTIMCLLSDHANSLHGALIPVV